MNKNYAFPSNLATASTEPAGTDQRTSNVLRASVLDAALLLGFGTSDSKVAKWMFNEDVDEGDEDLLDSPGLTSSASTAPSPNTSDESYVYPTGTHAPTFARDSPLTPPVFPRKAPGQDNLHIRRPSSEPMHYDHHGPEFIPPPPSTKPRNKLTKKRADGSISEGEVMSRKKSSQDLSKSERKELEKAKARREKEEKKEKKAAKKATAAGYDTDAIHSSTKRSKSREGGYETDDGYQSAGSKRSMSKFFRLGNRSKGEVGRSENSLEDVIPPVPELPPIHPIADKFGLSLSFDTADDSRSITPTPVSTAPSNGSFISSMESSNTLQSSTGTTTMLASEPSFSPARKEAFAPPQTSSSSASSLPVPSVRVPSRDLTPDSSDEETLFYKPKTPPKIRIPTHHTPFIMRSPQGSPLSTPTPPRLHSPMGRVGLPSSPRPTDAASLLHPSSGTRSPIPPPSPQQFDPTHLYAGPRSPIPPPSPQQFDAAQLYANSESSTAPAISRSASPAHLHPGYQRSVPPPSLNVLASTEYVIPSPLPSPVPRAVSQYGLPPPTPPPQSPLPAPPTPDAVRRPSFTASSLGMRARVRSQKYDRAVLPRRNVRSEEGHGASPSSFAAPRDKRHQSVIAAPVVVVDPDADDEDGLHSPVQDILSRYGGPDGEEAQEWGHALARNESMKRKSARRQQQQPSVEGSLSDDESIYPDEDDTVDWDASHYEESLDSHSQSHSQHHYYSSDPSVESYSSSHGSARARRPSHSAVPAGGPKPGWI